MDVLLPGLTQAQIRNLARDVPFELGHDLEVLYSWHNGTTDTMPGVPTLFPGGLFMRVQSAVHEYVQRVEIARRLASNDKEAAETYDPTWFPIFLDAGGNVHVVVLSGDGAGGVWFVPIEEPELRFQVAPDLASTIDFVITCYERRAYFVSPDGAKVDVNARLEAEIRRGRLDPAPVVPELVRQLLSADPIVASRAFDAIRRLRFPDAVPHLIRLLDHDSPIVRRRAVLLLGALEDPTSVPALAGAMVDSEAAVREAASAALNRVQGSGDDGRAG